MPVSKTAENVAKLSNKRSTSKIPSINEIPLKDGILETVQYKSILALCFSCRTKKELGVIYGDSGIGKSTALKSFVTNFNDTVMVTARTEMSLKDLLNVIASKLNIVLRGSRYERVCQIVECLQKSSKTLVIDEAENLVTYSVQKMEVLREIFDEASIGMILCGTPRLERLLTKGPSYRENLSQFYSRIDYRLKLNGIQEDEVRSLLDNLPVTADGADELVDYALNNERGGMRIFSKVLQRSLDLFYINGKNITRDIVREAAQLIQI